MMKGRAPCCDKTKVKRGCWSAEEDLKLISHIQKFGHDNWRAIPVKAGLSRCGKSCRLRWINYLSPNVKRGNFTPEEEMKIIKLHKEYGNKWSKIVSHLPGRTDNEIKNVWNTYLKKRSMVEDNINKPMLLTSEPQDALKLIASTSSTIQSSISAEAISDDQHEKMPQDPNKCSVSSSTTRDFKQENLPSPSTSNISYLESTSNISYLNDSILREAEEEFLKFEDELFQTSLDPEFDFWFMLENTSQTI